MLRSIVKLVISATFYYSGLLVLYSKLKSLLSRDNNIHILMYHRVLPDDMKKQAIVQPGMSVTQSMFESSMKFIKKNYDVVSLEEIIAVLEKGETVKKKTIAVTFDDGWRDNYQFAYPVLKSYDIPAIIFVSTELIQTNRLPIFMEACILLGEGDLWPDKAVTIFNKIVKEHDLIQSQINLTSQSLNQISINAYWYMRTLMLLEYKYISLITSELKKACSDDISNWDNQRWMLNWDEIKDMYKHNITFGSHAISHDLLIHLDHDRIDHELIESKNIIESNTGIQVSIFSYPNGDYNREIKSMVQKAGYSGAVAVTGCYSDESKLDIFALRRRNINEGAALGPAGNFSKSIFACLIEGIL